MKKRLLWLAMALFVSTGLMAQSWYLAGSSTSGDSGWLDGKNWDASGTAMTDNSDGTFSYSTTVQAGTYEFKVTDGTWDTSYGYDNVNSTASTSGYENNGGNIRFNIAAEADITIVFNPSATSITLTSSISFGQVVITVWTVVGDEALCGSDWDPADANNDMAEDAETPGIWTKTYENFEVNADNAGTVISFKAVANHNYSVGEVPQGEGNNATLTLPEETGIYNITLTLNTGDRTLSNEIVKVGGEEPEPEPTEPVLLVADDIAVSWNEPVYNAETKELQLSCTFDIAETQTSVSIDDLLAANPVCFIRFGESGDINASREGNAVSVTIPNVEAGAELAYSFAMNIGADNADVITPTRIEIVNPEWVYAPGVPGPEPEPGITTLYMIGDATPGGWALENATALAYDADSKTFTWTGDLNVGTEGFKFVVSNTAYVPCFVAASEGQQLVSGEQVALVYRENEEAGAPADYKFKVPEDGNYTVVVTMDGTEASMVVTQNSVAPVPQWYVAGNGNENVPEWVNGKNWNPDAAPMTANGDGTFSYSTTIPAGTYEFKVTNGTWEAEQGSVVYDYNHINAATSTSGYENAGGNVKFTISEQADITISLNPEAADNEKITLTSSIQFGQAEITLWTVVGDAALCGSDWDPADANNDMAEDAETPGIWTKTYENFEVNADNAGTVISFKAVANHNYSVGEVPQGEGNNATLTLPSEPGIYNITLTLNTGDGTLSNEIVKVGGEEPEPVEPVVPTADSYVVEWSEVYDAEAGTLTLTAKITAAADAGFTMDQITGAQAEIIYDDGTQTSGRIDINADNGFTASYTIPDIQPGSTVDYSLKIVTGGNDVVGASDVSGIAPDSYIVPDGEEPEPAYTDLYIIGDVNGWALAAEDWKGVTSDGVTYTWTWAEAVEITKAFKINDGDWEMPNNFGPISATTLDAASFVDGVAVIAVQDDANSQNMTVAVGAVMKVTAISLNVSSGQLSITGAIEESTEPAPEITVWTVAGDEVLFGSNWDITAESGNDMVQDGENPEIWTKTFENFEVTAENAGITVNYKAIANHDYAIGEVPVGMDNNATVTLPSELGIYNITLTLNTGDWTLSNEIVKVGGEEPEPVETTAKWSFLLNGDNSLTVICTVNALGGQTDPSAVAGLVGWMYVDNPATQLGWVAGSFEIVYTTEVLTDGQTVTLNATWNWQDGGAFTAPEPFIYRFNEEEPEPVPAAWYIAGNGDVDAAWVGGLSWDVAGVALTDNGDGTYGYETTVPAGTYQFKITNGKWYDPENTPDGINYGYTNVDGVASTSGYVDGGGNNVMFTIASEATITITLNPAAMDDAKIILSSTVGFGEAVVDRWTLAGDVPFFAGSAWGFDAGNDLVETAHGVWTKVYENVEVTSDMAGQPYQYKVGANGGFDVDQYPAQGNNTFTMPAEAGSYNITFTFNAEGERTLDFECVMNEPTSIGEAAVAVITAADGRIYCDKDFIIVNLAGQDVTAANGDLQGTYLVVAGDEVVKVMVD